MKTKVFTFILLALAMISYSSCSSEAPNFDTDTETVIEHETIYKLQQSIQGGTFRCTELNSEMYIKPRIKGVVVEVEIRGNIVNPEWFPSGYAGYILDVNSDYTLTNQYFESLKWKIIDSNTLEGLTEVNKGIWKRVK